jgi:MscS family membrane protein
MAVTMNRPLFPRGQASIRASILLGFVLLVGQAGRASAADPAHPLAPPDRSSPRATLATFAQSFDVAWRLFSSRSPAFRESFLVARGCLDDSRLSASVVESVSGEATLLLKEVLDRIPLPPESEIPGADEVKAQGLTRYTLPRTEITLEKAASGEQQGQFLFTPSTVARAREFYEKVRHMPYQPGRQGAHYDELRFGGLSPEVSRLAASLPAWARREVGGALAWQWAAVLLGVVLALFAAAAAFRLGRRWARWEDTARGGRRFGPFLFPLTLLALALGVRAMAWMFLRLAGTPYVVLSVVLTAIAHLAAAWLIAVALTRFAELVLRVFRTPEQPLNAQLVGVSFKILTILAVTGYLFVAAQSLGLPVPALVAGLGVGGLAVALATQGTLENLISGLILYADRPVRVGDVFRLGDRIGVVDEIGLRSTRIRTIERSIIAIPNSDMVRREIENLTLQDRIPLRTRLRLGLETTPDQVRRLLASLVGLIRQHPRLVQSKGGARLVGYGEYSVDVDVRAFAATTDYFEFLAIREDVLLRVMGLVEEAGTRLAVPVRLQLTAEDAGLDRERAHGAEPSPRPGLADGSPAAPARTPE